MGDHLGLLDDILAPAMRKAGGGGRGPSLGTPADPQAWDHDPYDEWMFQQYNNVTNGRGLAYPVRENMASAPHIAPLISLRCGQFRKFAVRQKNRYAFGFKVGLRETRRAPTREEGKEIERFTRLVETCGSTEHDEMAIYKRDLFPTFMHKVGRDSIIHDALTFEIMPDSLDRPVWWRAIDAKTVRRIEPGMQLANPSSDIMFDQYIADAVRASWNAKNLAFGVRRPRTDIHANGYGFPELDELFTVVMGLLHSLDYNMNYFRQGSTTKGILKIIGNIPQKQLRAFKRYWAAMVSGVANSWRTPIINVPHEKGDVAWVPMSQTNRDMEWSMFNDFLMWLAMVAWGIDEAEVGGKFASSGGQKAMFESDNEARLRLSRERGVQPYLQMLQEKLNVHVIWRLNEDLALTFEGIDTLSEKERVELDAKRVTTTTTIDEIRAEDDREAIPDGNGKIVMNQVFTMWAQQQAAMKQQQEAGAAGAPGAEGQEGPGDDAGDAGDDMKPGTDDRFDKLWQQVGEEEDRPGGIGDRVQKALGVKVIRELVVHR